MKEAAIKAKAIELATELTVAWLTNPHSKAEAADVPALFQKIHSAVSAAVSGSGDDRPEETPAAPALSPEHPAPMVNVSESLRSDDHIISLINGKPYRTLKRHLAAHGLTPQAYRARYGLPDDYPMVAQSLSEQRSKVARGIGLGRSPATLKSKSATPGKASGPDADAVPAVSVKKSLASRDHLLSLIDGKPYKALRRHLTAHGLTPDTYRERYGLPADYPMVAPAYSARRSEVARQFGLGRKRAGPAKTPH